MRPTDIPLVSIITPTHNAGRFLTRLIACVRAQIGVSYEHVIVNDASTDDSADRLEHLVGNDARTQVIHCPQNVGVVMARNLAITKARGRFLAFLDADDVWLPEKLWRQTTFMLQTGSAISYTDYRFLSEDGTQIGPRLAGPERIGWHLHHMTRYLGCLTVMVDREQSPDFTFGSVSPEYRAEDFLAWAKIITRHGYAYRCPYDLARYAVVASSRSSSGTRAARTVWRLYRDVERIPPLQAALYFGAYALFASGKRFFYRPRWPTRQVDHVTWSLEPFRNEK